MHKNNLLPMNLQFFAEGEEGDVTQAEVVEQPEGEVTQAEVGEEGNESVTEEVTEPQFQTDKANKAFADLRRRAEAAERRAAEIDNLYAKQFGSYTNPETGEPIRSASDYVEAMAAQERIKAKEQLRENNIDPSLIDKLIANSPVVRQAQEATQELNNFRVQQQIDEDLKKILAIDSRFGSLDELKADPSMNEVADYCQSHPGVRADEAYKIINFDRLSSQKVGAAKQAAINQVKGKNHLNTGAALNVDDGMEDIPADQLESYKEAFPEKTMKEIKALYNKAKALRG